MSYDNRKGHLVPLFKFDQLIPLDDMVYSAINMHFWNTRATLSFLSKSNQSRGALIYIVKHHEATHLPHKRFLRIPTNIGYIAKTTKPLFKSEKLNLHFCIIHAMNDFISLIYEPIFAGEKHRKEMQENILWALLTKASHKAHARFLLHYQPLAPQIYSPRWGNI